MTQRISLVILVVFTFFSCDFIKSQSFTENQDKMYRFYKNKYLELQTGVDFIGDIKDIRKEEYIDSTYYYIDKSIEESPSNYINYIYRLRIYYINKEYDSIVDYVDGLDKKVYKGHSADFDFFKGVAYDRKGNLKQAQKYYKKTQRYFNKHKNSFLRMNVVLFEITLQYLIDRNPKKYAESLTKDYYGKNPPEERIIVTEEDIKTIPELEDWIVLDEFSLRFFLW